MYICCIRISIYKETILRQQLLCWIKIYHMQSCTHMHCHCRPNSQRFHNLIIYLSSPFRTTASASNKLAASRDYISYDEALCITNCYYSPQWQFAIFDRISPTGLWSSLSALLWSSVHCWHLCSPWVAWPSGVQSKWTGGLCLWVGQCCGHDEWNGPPGSQNTGLPPPPTAINNTRIHNRIDPH